jgi:deazaflavin-dependent oxidoreductase (nitroreductase family)
MHLNNALVHLIDRLTQQLYIWSDGRIGHHQRTWTILLLTTTGRRSGVPRTHALVYLQEDDQLLIVASNNGSDRPPAWYCNLVANPRVHVRYGRNQGFFTARIATPAEYSALWNRLRAYHPLYTAHQARTRRTLPIVILTPLSG